MYSEFYFLMWSIDHHTSERKISILKSSWMAGCSFSHPWRYCMCILCKSLQWKYTKVPLGIQWCGDCRSAHTQRYSSGKNAVSTNVFKEFYHGILFLKIKRNPIKFKPAGDWSLAKRFPSARTNFKMWLMNLSCARTGPPCWIHEEPHHLELLKEESCQSG